MKGESAMINSPETVRIDDNWRYIPMASIIYANCAVTAGESTNIPEELENIVSERVKKYNSHSFRPGSQYAASLLLTNDCNMKCIYCYAKGQRKKDAMTYPVLVTAVDYIINNHITNAYREKPSEQCHFTFIGGGEPTMNWTVLERGINHINKRSREMDKDIRINLVTNGGWKCQKRTDWLVDNVDHISLSLDGYYEVQSKQRPCQHSGNTKSAYANMEKIMATMHKAGKSMGIRATVTKDSIGELEQICDYFSTTGASTIHIEPVYLPSGNDNVKTKLKHFPNPDTFIDKYISLRDKYANKGIRLYTSLDTLNNIRMQQYCAFQNAETIAITPDGHVTGCIEVSSKEDPDFQYFNYGIVNPITNTIEFRKDIASTVINVDTRGSSCTKCIARWNCGGGCLRKSKRYLTSRAIPENNVLCEIVQALLIKSLYKSITGKPNKTMGNIRYIDLKEG